MRNINVSPKEANYLHEKIIRLFHFPLTVLSDYLVFFYAEGG